MGSNQEQPVVVLACDVLQTMIENLLPAHVAEQVTFFDFGLHAVPKKMRVTLQEAIDSIEIPSIVVLGYGLCGNGLKGIKAGKHTLLMPRVDDCVAMMLGSRQAYRDEFSKEPGTYYLAKGWLERSRHQLEEVAPAISGYSADPLLAYEANIERYGTETADWLMDQQYRNYRRLALVAPNPEEMDKYRPRAKEIAAFCQRWDMRYEELPGSTVYIHRLIEAGLGLSHGDGNGLSDDFLVIPAGSEIRAEQFL